MSSENEALLESQDRNKYGAVSPEEAGEEHEVDVVVETPQNASNWATKISGIMFVILSGWSFTAANVIQKIICPSLNFWSLILIRSVTQTLVMGSFLFFTKKSNENYVTRFMGPRENRTILFLQGIFGGMLLLTIFVAVKHVPLGNVSAIIFCTPVSFE